MRRSRRMTYTEKVQRRIRLLYALLVGMLAYMVMVVELGGGDSREMSEFAQSLSRTLYFSGIIYIISRIIYYKRLLKNRLLLKEKRQKEQDERNQYLHDKSGGWAMDVLLFCLLVITWTTALFNREAFYTSVVILAAASALKFGSYWYASHKIDTGEKDRRWL
ncbi:MAG: hypothetical protein HFI40_09600 [Lachnospiraceae bacterium]|jgi:hypothetical protein|nr:hypothetical protein [Lachnospiraceae bacterium]